MYTQEWHNLCGVQIGLARSEIISWGFVVAREQQQSIKQSLVRGCKIAFMVNMRSIGCVLMCIKVFVGLQVKITMVDMQ